MIESGDERGKWDKKGARKGHFSWGNGEMAENGTSDDSDEEDGETSNGPIRRLGAFLNPRCLPDECSVERNSIALPKLSGKLSCKLGCIFWVS